MKCPKCGLPLDDWEPRSILECTGQVVHLTPIGMCAGPGDLRCKDRQIAQRDQEIERLKRVLRQTADALKYTEPYRGMRPSEIYADLLAEAKEAPDAD